MKLISRARRTPIACGQQHRQPPARHHADAGVGVAELGPLGRDEEVAVERQLEAAGDGDAVDRADQRLGRAGGNGPRLRRRCGSVGAADAAEVAAVDAELLRSSPAQNAGSAPVRMSTSTSSSASASREQLRAAGAAPRSTGRCAPPAGSA